MMKTGLVKNALRSLVGTKMGQGFDIVPRTLVYTQNIYHLLIAERWKMQIKVQFYFYTKNVLEITHDSYLGWIPRNFQIPSYKTSLILDG